MRDAALALRGASGNGSGSGRGSGDGHGTALLLGGRAVHEKSLLMAGRIAEKTGCGLISEYNSARLQRGAGRVSPQRVPYVVDSALALLEGLRHIVLVGAMVKLL